MDTWIALLRGINVGGRNVLPMKTLRAVLEDLGLQHVRTYIQSGNCIFDCEAGDRQALSAMIADAIERRQGFRPRVLILTHADLRHAIADNPFAGAEDDPRKVHLFFLSEPAADPDLALLDGARTSGEAFQLIGSVFYLHTPEGFHSSKVAAKVEKALGVDATARNLRSAEKIATLV